MEEIKEIVDLISKVVTIIIVPLLGIFLFYNSKKRKETAAAVKAEAEYTSQYADEWKELYDKKDAEAIELKGKIDKLYSEKNNDRLRIRESMEEITRLKLEKQELEFLKCNIALRCFKRVPPNNFVNEQGDD
ncbi:MULTISPECIES: hypothetical protein [Butyricimonas]|uniref:hypothetical protein n=1 Tax=Butyricimonas TaxID=574697 RepID=UPI0007FB2827|nr:MULTISPECIES: hypothetical protein [Butyricimonas]